MNLPNIRRGGLPPAHAAVIDLKIGEVSQVISDSGGHYIYKVNSKTQMPLDQVKARFTRRLQNDRMREMMDKVNSSFKADDERSLFWAGRSVTDASARSRVRRRECPGSATTQPQTAPPAQPPAAQPN